MSDDIAVPIIGAFSAVFFLLLLLEFFVARRIINRSNRRSVAVAKAIVATHGTKTWDSIVREFTENYKVGLSEDATLDIIADAYEDESIEQIEAKNSFAGSYSPNSDFQNAETLGKYLDVNGTPTDLVKQRQAFKERQTDALAISIVLNLIRQGSLKREQAVS